MTDLAELKSGFDTVAMANRYAALSDEQWAILVEGEGEKGIDLFRRMIAAARAGNPTAVDLVKTWHKAARIAAQLRANDFGPVSKRQARKLLETHDTDRVVGALQGAIEGNRGLRQQIVQWLEKIRAELGDARPVESSEPTAVSGAPVQRSASSSRFAAVPPPPGVQTGQVTSTAHWAAASDAPSRNPPAAEGLGSRAASVTRIQSSRPQDSARTQGAPQRQPAEGRSQYASGSLPSSLPASGQRAPEPPAQGEVRQYDQHVCYGRDVALAFECLPNMERTANTVMLKIARARYEGKTCKEGVNWNDAILINLEPHEVQTVAAVFLGMHDRVRYAGHGRDNQKWFEVQESTGEWAGSIRVTIGHGEEKRTVSIGATDVGEVAALFLRALSSQLKVAPALFGSIIKRAVEFYRHNETRQQARRGGAGGSAARSNPPGRGGDQGRSSAHA